jgi:hypothetical protein
MNGTKTNTSARACGFTTSEDLKIYSKMTKYEPLYICKDDEKPFIKTLKINFNDILRIFEDPEELQKLIKAKIAEVSTIGENTKIILNTIEGIIYLIHKEDKQYMIMSEYSLNHECYIINWRQNLSKEPRQVQYIISDLLDAVKYYEYNYELENINNSVFPLYNYDGVRYFFNDIILQEEKIIEEFERSNDIYNVKLSKKQSKKLREKIINDRNLKNIFTYWFEYDYHDFTNIKRNMRDFDLCYKHDENKVIELLNITKKVLKNQYYNDYHDEITETPSDYGDNFIRCNKLNNIFSSFDREDVDDSNEKDKLKNFYKYIEREQLQKPIPDNIFYSNGPQDSFINLFNLVQYYLDKIKYDYDETVSECIILSLIYFHYDLIHDYIHILKAYTLALNSTIINPNYKELHNIYDRFKNCILRNTFFKNHRF